MDIAVYLVAAALLIALILFALKVRGETQEGKSIDSERLTDVSC